MSNFIVTGCAGFIGSHLTERLLADGHYVIGVDNMSTGEYSNMKEFEESINFEFHKLDITDKSDMEYLVRCYADDIIHGIFHTAALARIQPAILNPQLNHDTNVTGLFNVLEFMRKCGIKNIVFSSSSSIYGLANESPLTENMPQDCLNPYSFSKFAGEQMIKTWCKLYDLRGINLRYFNVYGPREVLNAGIYSPVLGLFYKQVLKDKQSMTIVGDGEQRRDMTHVSDVVEANTLAMRKCMSSIGTVDALGEAYNVGTGCNCSINEMATFISDALSEVGVKATTTFIPPRVGESRVTKASIDMTRKVLGYEPKVSFAQGVKQQRDYYLEKFK